MNWISNSDKNKNKVLNKTKNIDLIHDEGQRVASVITTTIGLVVVLINNDRGIMPS